MGTPILSQAQLDAQKLIDEEKELERKLALVKQQRRELQEGENRKALELAKQQALSKPIEVKILQLIGGNILLENDYRDDVIELLRQVPNRSYRGNR